MKTLLLYFFAFLFLTIVTVAIWPKNKTFSQPTTPPVQPPNFTPGQRSDQNKLMPIIKIIDSSKVMNEKDINEHRDKDEAREIALTKAQVRIMELEIMLKLAQNRIAKNNKKDTLQPVYEITRVIYKKENADKEINFLTSNKSFYDTAKLLVYRSY